jgi:uncharacterized protein (DUF2252 family)
VKPSPTHSAQEHREYGRGRRRALRRSAQSRWDVTKRSYDPLEILKAASRGRIAALVPLKMARMAISPFCFYRGSVALMAADLALLPYSRIYAQICGDAHVQNLGAFAGPDGRLIFDVNDFDETVYGPWEWDIKRMSASLILAGREAPNSDSLCRDAVGEFMKTYREDMRAFAKMPVLEVASYRVRREFEGGPGSAVLLKAERTTPLRSLEKLTRERNRGLHVFKEMKPVLTHPSKPKAREVVAALKMYRETLAPARRHILDFYRPADVAFKVVGMGSVATFDYVVLCFGNGPGDPLFLQVKEEPPSSYDRYLMRAARVTHQGRRVVEGQRRMQVQSDPLLGWTSFGGREFLVRQLSDHKAAIENKLLKGEGLMHYARLCGEILAKGHGRSGDPSVLAGYFGSSDVLDRAIEKFAIKYADQVTLDYEKFKIAIRNGKIHAARCPSL